MIKIHQTKPSTTKNWPYNHVQPYLSIPPGPVIRPFAFDGVSKLQASATIESLFLSPPQGPFCFCTSGMKRRTDDGPSVGGATAANTPSQMREAARGGPESQGPPSRVEHGLLSGGAQQAARLVAMPLHGSAVPDQTSMHFTGPPFVYC